MKVKLLYVCFVCLFFFRLISVAQLASPDLRCLSVAQNGDITLTWINTPDPTAIFTSYNVYVSPTSAGPYTLVASIGTNATNIFNHVGAAGDVQAKYYYMETVSNGNITSTPSFTLRSIQLGALTSPVISIANLSWNAMSLPLLPSSNTTYTVQRENPTNTWVNLQTTSKLNDNDTITECSIFYGYKILIADAFGCVSQSNYVSATCQDKTVHHIPIIDSVSVNADGTTTIGWPAPFALDVIKYEIYKIDAGLPVLVGTVNGHNNTSFTYLGLEAASTSVEFEIVAFDKCGSPNSTIRSKTMHLTKNYDRCTRQNQLTWNAYVNLPQATIQKYKVYASKNGGAFNVIGITNVLNFVHQNLIPNATYNYYVRVVNGFGNYSASSSYTTVIADVPAAPNFIYIKSVSVNLSKTVDVTFALDTTQIYKGIKVLKSENGINFNYLKTISVGTRSIQSFNDEQVRTTESNYYYKLVVLDDCNNDRDTSNTSKTIKLQVQNNTESIYYNALSWTDYTTWQGNVESYNIYRAINGNFNTTPIANVSSIQNSYLDNVQEFSHEQGKISYYVEAVEGLGNTFGFKDKAKSNPADAYVEAEIFVPNAFYPKGTGVNKIWLPVTQYVEKTDYKVTVYNRWGQKMFETTSDTEGWDGQTATDDVYVYFIEYKNARGEFIQLKGHITVIR